MIPYPELIKQWKDFDVKYLEFKEYVKKYGADILRNFRAGNYLTQLKAAEYLGISTNYISKIENGDAPLSIDVLEKIIAYKEAG